MTTDAGAKKNDFKSIFHEQPLEIPKVGDVLKGKVIAAEKGMVIIDIDGLTTGVVRGNELFVESHEYNNLKPGAEVEATVVELENENGEMELSFRIAGFKKAWDGMKKLLKDGATIAGKVVGANKGGLMMQVEALAGFMPVSQLSPEHYPRVAGGDKNRIFEKLKEMVGLQMEVKVIDVDEKEEKLIVSERAVWEDAQKAVLESYKIGDVVTGEVSALTTFGAFVKFGDGLEGLVHISEIAWQRIDHPKDILKVGESVKAQVIQLDKSKIYLSIKRTMEDPWKRVKDRYAVGQKVKGKIIKIESFGLMVALDREIHALAHVSELADTLLANLTDKFKIGGEYEFEIVSLEPAEHRLGLKLAGVKGKTARKIGEKSAQGGSSSPEASGKEEKVEDKPSAVEASSSAEAVEDKPTDKPVEAAPAATEEKPAEAKIE